MSEITTGYNKKSGRIEFYNDTVSVLVGMLYVVNDSLFSKKQITF